MANPQYLYGDVIKVEETVATALAVTKGDFCARVSSTLQKASGQTWDTNLLTTQAAFVTNFLGVAEQDKTANVARIPGNKADNVIVIAQSGTWSYDAVSASYTVGQYVGPADSGSSSLLDAKVVGVAAITAAIGVSVENATTVTRLKIRILPKLAEFAR